MNGLIVIPARWASTRLPGKPLATINGVSLLERVVLLARAGKSDAETVVVAVDDGRVADHCDRIGQRWVMTDPSIASGTRRALAAARLMPDTPDYIINLQGDAPFLPVSTIALIAAALRAGHQVVTPVVPLSWVALDAFREHKRVSPFSGTTCIRADDGRALWFSKSVIPAMRDEPRLREHEPSPVLRHLGLYGFSMNMLARYADMPAGRYEQLEQLEQLRLIEGGVVVHTIMSEEPVLPISGIDTADDILLAERLIGRHGEPSDR